MVWRAVVAICMALAAVAITAVGSSERAAISGVVPVVEEFAAADGAERADVARPVPEPESELTFRYEGDVDDEPAPIVPENISYQASLEVAGAHMCGGTLITQQSVLTAASCVRGITEGQLSVRLGAQNRLVEQTELLPVAEIVPHPDAGVGFGPDLAIVHLIFPANVMFRPVGLPLDEAPNFGTDTRVSLSGWGRPHLSTRATNETFSVGQSLLTAEADACNGIGDLVGTEILCVGNGAVTEDGVVLCMTTDLGGPVIVGNLDSYSVGTIGFGNRCEGPLVATPTANHLDWVLDVVDHQVVDFGPR